MSGGPQPMARAQRLQLAFKIADQIHDHYGDDVLAIGVYGSVARGMDGPYSDIEMHCVLRGRGVDTAHEWSVGPWKAEVDVYSEDVVLGRAAEVDVDWPITHGAFAEVLALYDPTGFFSRLRVAALSQPEYVFQQTMRDVIVGELYERVGKIRNARMSQNNGCVPYLAVELAKFGACLIGLAHRHLYTSGPLIFEESLTLPGRPDGYDALCRVVMVGELTDTSGIADATDVFWAGVENWARERRILIEEELENLLSLGKEND